MINIELSSKCTKGCCICSRSVGKKHFPDMDMNFDTFHKVLEKIPDKSFLQLHGRGSSELNPNFEVMTNMLKKAGNHLFIDTNGSFLNKVSYLSFDTVTVSTFEEDKDWKSQINKIIDFKKDSNNPRLILRINGK